MKDKRTQSDLQGYNTLTWKRFERDDWYGWAGATRFAFGGDPLIAEGSGWLAIWDAEGVGFYQAEEDEGVENGWAHLENAEVFRVGGVNPAWTFSHLLQQLGLRRHG